MKKILFITLYDMICIGQRLLSSIAKQHGVEPHLVVFKDQRTRPILRDSRDFSVYQVYVSGIKYGSCYAAYPYTKREIELFVDLVGRTDPDVICLSTRSFGYSGSKEIFQAVKQRFNIPIIGGGWGPTLEPEKFLEFCDCVCFGEGEQTIAEICQRLKKDETTFRDVSNLMYYENGNLKRNAVAEPLDGHGLANLPFADFDVRNKYMIDDNRVQSGREFYNEKIFNCFIGRGCPFDCTYCMSSKYRAMYKGYGYSIKKYRIRDVPTVIRELEEGKRAGALYVRFGDEVFPIFKDWVNEFLAEYKAKIDLPFFAYVRPEFHSPELIARMRDAGLATTVVGIQAGSSHIRHKVFRRTFSREKLIDFATTLRDLGVAFSYHLINFNPFETEKHMRECFEFLLQLPFAPMTVFKLVPFRGAPIYDMIQEESPVMEPGNIQKWYGYLCTMATKNRTYRSLARFILDHKLFRGNLLPFVALFLPNFIELQGRKLIRKWKYGAATVVQIPIKARKK